MMSRRRWFERQFELGLPLDAFPDIVERVRGTPARLEERVGQLPSPLLASRLDDQWSIQENVGHLLDLEPLWSGRVADLLEGKPDLREADLQNRKTHEAGHNERRVQELLRAFRKARMSMVGQLEALTDQQLVLTSRHPRLRQPMSVVDLCFLVAEHDDHHLARITEVLARMRNALA